VAEEVGQLLRVELATLFRYEPGRTATSVTTWGPAGENLPVGIRWPLGGTTSPRSCSRPAARPGSTAMPIVPRARSVPPSERRASARRSGRRSSSREVCGGRFCRFDPGAAPAAGHRGTAGLLHRAGGGGDREHREPRGPGPAGREEVAPEEVFAAVAEEVGRLLPVDRASMVRYEPDAAATFVASWGRASELFPVGRQFSLAGHDFATLVSQTGLPARIDNPAESMRGPSPSPSARRASARRSGCRSSSRAACGA
jgi:hypothetical protein